jgi:hypothetical protein
MKLLRLALRADAVGCAALGLLTLGIGPLLKDGLGLPLIVLEPLSLVLLASAVLIWFVAAQPRISRAAAWTIIALNALWVLDSLAALAFGWLTLTTLGVAFVIAQAIATAIVADLEFVALRRAPA